MKVARITNSSTGRVIEVNEPNKDNEWTVIVFMNGTQVCKFTPQVRNGEVVYVNDMAGDTRIYGPKEIADFACNLAAGSSIFPLPVTFG